MRSLDRPVRLGVALALTAALTLVAGPVLADPGQLDSRFSDDGETTVSYTDGDEEAMDLVVMGDRKPVIVGTANGNLTITRFLAGGTLDTTFSGDGRLSLDMGGPDVALAGARQGLKVLVAGMASGQAGLARVTAGGARDRTFSGDGRLIVDPPDTGVSQFDAVADAGDGRVVAVGLAIRTDLGRQLGLIVRTTASGALDRTFSGDGIRFVDGFKPTRARDVLVLPSGKLLVLLDDPSARIIRLKANGALDTTFGDAGSVRPPVPMKGRALARDGSRIVLVGAPSTSTFAVARFLADGSPDLSFAGDGVLVLDDETSFGEFPAADDVAVATDHRVVVAGSNQNLLIVRVTSTGALDTSFNFGLGYAELGGPGADAATGVAIDSSGRIVVGGVLGGAVAGQGDQWVGRILAE